MARNKPATADITPGVPLELVGEQGPVAQIVLTETEMVVKMLAAGPDFDADLVLEGPTGNILADVKRPRSALPEPQQPPGDVLNVMSRLSDLAQRLGADTNAVLDVMVEALTQLSAIPPEASQLPERDAQLLDAGGLTNSPGSYARAVAKSAAAVAELRVTAASPSQVAAALKVSMARVRQLRGDRALWAIREGADRWAFPTLQFEVDPRAAGVRTRQIPGLAAVFQTLPEDLHPLALQGFLLTPQPDLVLDGVPVPPLVWLRSGGNVTPVLGMVQASEYAK